MTDERQLHQDPSLHSRTCVVPNRWPERFEWDQNWRRHSRLPITDPSSPLLEALCCHHRSVQPERLWGSKSSRERTLQSREKRIPRPPPKEVQVPPSRGAGGTIPPTPTRAGATSGTKRAGASAHWLLLRLWESGTRRHKQLTKQIGHRLGCLTLALTGAGGR